MPHRLSLTRRLAVERRRFTRETMSALMPAVVQALAPVDADVRRRLAAALDNLDAPIPSDVHGIVLPDATTPEQRALEAGIFRVAAESVPHAFRAVRPLIGQLELNLRPET